MKLRLLRYLFLVDAAVLALLGAFFVFAPRHIEVAFGFPDLPPAISYIIGLWGCGLGTLSIGYMAAAANPIRHRIWAQVGMARGSMETALGLFYLAQGIVTIRQAAVGIVVAAMMTLAYAALYPRKPRLVEPGGPALANPQTGAAA
jgi:hypothetical protein